MLDWLKKQRRKKYDTSKKTVTSTSGVTSKAYKGKSGAEIAKSNRERRKIFKSACKHCDK